MNATTRWIGILLTLAGLLALMYGGFTYTKHREVLELGPIEATVEEKKTIPVEPIVGAIALVAGVALILADRKHA